MAKIIKIKSRAKKNMKETVVDDIESPDHYDKLIKANPLDQKAYHRLMIIYRKKKEYKKEMKIINTAIKAFESFYKSHKKTATKQVQTISHKLSRAMGLTDHKGKSTHDMEPIATWRKRKEQLEKKI